MNEPTSSELGMAEPNLAAVAPSRSLEGNAWLDWTAIVLACVVGAALVYWAAERSAFQALFGTAHLAVTPTESALMVATALATTWTAMLPILTVAGVCLALRRRRIGFAVFVVGLVVVHSMVVYDVQLYRTFGLHMLDLVAFARLPHGGAVAGSAAQWAWLIAKWGFMVLVVSLGLTYGTVRAVRSSLGRTSRSLQVFVGVLIGVLLVVATFVPHEMGNFWRHPVFRERHYGLLAFDLRRDAQTDSVSTMQDPGLSALSEGMQRRYLRYFPMVFGPKPNDLDVKIEREHPPNVIVIAFESFRHTALNEELMPKLTRWARGGLRSKRHHAGSIYSEAGLFSLLYGRSPLVFHSTLDGQIRPSMCEILGASGYESAYFTGHPKRWMRREAYINPDTFDRFVHDDHGGWNEWDLRALSKMAEAANAASDRPLFALVFLMSSHFEYQYPPSYEKFTPVDRDAKWSAAHVTQGGAEAREPLLNRYRNTMAFLDDEVSRAIDALDPAKNIVIITGDHGESIYDDGRYGHGYAFSDIVVRVPFAMVGPGVEARELDAVTLHADVLPTVLHAVSGHHIDVKHVHGVDLLEPVLADRTALLAHCGVNHDKAMAVLLAGGHRVSLNLDLHKPRLRLLGIEDDRGYLLPDQHLSAEDVPALLDAFESELDNARR